MAATQLVLPLMLLTASVSALDLPVRPLGTTVGGVLREKLGETWEGERGTADRREDFLKIRSNGSGSQSYDDDDGLVFRAGGSTGEGKCGLWGYLLDLALKPGVAACTVGRSGNQNFTLAEDLVPFTTIPDARNWPKFGVTLKMGLATVFGFVGAALANAVGLGGGGLFVPMFNILLGFDAKTSAALSKAMVLGGSLAAYSINCQLRDPLGLGPRIDYNIALLFVPCLVLGISIGVSFNVMFPGWLIIVLLTLFLGSTTYTVLKTGIKKYNVETSLQLANNTQRNETKGGASSSTNGNGGSQPTPAGQGNSTDGDITRPLLESNENGREEGTKGLGGRFLRNREGFYPRYVATIEAGVHLLDLDDIRGGVYATPPPSPRYAPRPKRKPRFFEKYPIGERTDGSIWSNINWTILGQLAGIWFLFFLIQLGKRSTERCGTRYWIINLLQIPIAILATISGAYQMFQKQKTESRENGRRSGRTPLTLHQISTYPLVALVAGIMGGLLGIGGGMVLGPVLAVQLKIPPQVTSATTSFMVIFSAAMSVTEFYLLGRIPIDFAIYYSGLSMIASLVGVSVVGLLVKRSGRDSIIIFILAFVIGVSGITIAVLGTAKVMAAYYAGAYMGFHSLCHD